MSILILNRNSLRLSPYRDWLGSVGEEIVVLTSKERLAAFGEDLDRFRDQYDHIEAIAEYDLSGLVERRALALHETRRFRHVVATAEFDLLRAARLRRRFGCAGQDESSASAYRDKLVMKEIVGRAGVPVPAQSNVASALDLIDFAAAQGYPVVLKPRTGAAAAGIRVLRDAADLDDLLASGLVPQRDLLPNLMAEAFVPGDMYHVDGLVIDGRPVVVWPCRYFNGPLAHLEDLPVGGSMLDADDPLCQPLQQLTRAAIAALPTPRATTFHAEFFAPPDGRLILCEIASRTAGGRVNDMLEHAFGIDVTGTWVRAQCGDFPDELGSIPDSGAQPLRMAGHMEVPRRADARFAPAEPPPFDWLIGFDAPIDPNEVMAAAANGSDQIATFIVAGENEGIVRSRLEAAQDWIDAQFVAASSNG